MCIRDRHKSYTKVNKKEGGTINVRNIWIRLRISDDWRLGLRLRICARTCIVHFIGNNRVGCRRKILIVKKGSFNTPFFICILFENVV